MIDLLRERWQGEGGCRHVLQLALPMVLSTASSTIQRFVDRMFLGWYSSDALAAGLPAGAFVFTCACFFLGTAGYVNTFVAQYTGAGRSRRVGAAIWQGLYFAMIAAVVLLAVSTIADPLFEFIGHAPNVRPLEADYFRILTLGGGAAVMSACLAGFYSGRGKMHVIMWVSVAMTGVNISLNYCWIFGRLGFPEMGIRGAAWATVCSVCVSLLIYLTLFWLPKNRREFGTAANWRIDRELFGRLLRYGLPNGVHFFLDVFAFAIFVSLAGRIGTVELGATNIAFGLNMLIFMPMIGFAIAISTLVGQSLGRNRPEVARRSTTSAAILTFAYMSVTAGIIVLVPDPFINLFRPIGAHEGFAQTRQFARVLLRFVAVYSLFDVANVTYAAALRGAGDTRYTMFASLVLSLGIMVLPVWISLEVLHLGLYTAWSFMALYVIAMGLVFFRRYLAGKWETMRVIESVSAPQVSVQAGPLVEVETTPLRTEPAPPAPADPEVAPPTDGDTPS